MPRKLLVSRKLLSCVAPGALALGLAAVHPATAEADGDGRVKHVLLISIDGMHALDFTNCAKGISGSNGGKPYCPNLAELKATGVNYLQTSTSEPSDSFPGLMAIVSGGSPRSVGAFYDVAYDRSLDPPTMTTGNGVAGSPGACQPGTAAAGTTTEFDEGIDIDKTKLNGGAPSGDGGINSIDPKKLERDPDKNCAPVYPWKFVRTNTIFGVIHKARGYTAWSDKHPSYSSVSGPATAVISTTITHRRSTRFRCAWPQVTLMSAIPFRIRPRWRRPMPGPIASPISSVMTRLKVQAILNEIDGQNHDGTAGRPCRPSSE